MQKMDGKSLDLVEVNRRAVIEALKEVAPEVVSESGVDLEKLAVLIGEDKNLSDKLERYNFTWPDKRKAIKSALTPSSGTLRPAPKESVNWDNTKNLYIEGDNLEVLKLLQKSYFGKIKMIYIDPPYNTGKEFVYPDDYADNIQNYLELTGQINESGRRITTNTETSGRYHTNWLNMMYPRLKLARNLLRDDGVIFISIDDHEVSNLRKICDEIFGEENFVALFTIRSNPRGSQSSKLVALEHEYILFYSKNSEKISLSGYEKTAIECDEYKFSDHLGKYRLLGLRQRGGAWRREQRPNMYYPIYVDIKTGEVSLYSDIKYTKVVYPTRPSGEEGRWTWSKSKFENQKHLLVGKKVSRAGEDDFWDIFRKDYLNSIETGKVSTKKPKSIWDEKELNYQNGRNEIKQYFGNSEIFDYPKPISIVTKCIKMLFLESDSIILDFFSGSATTAHAVMELNKEDGGNRQFIMVQLPEPCGKDTEAFKAGYKNICEIGKERIRRVIKKIDAEYAESEKSTQGELDLGAPAKQKPDLGFKVFKLDTSNFIPWDSNPDNLSEESLQRSLSNIKLDRSQQDLLYELFLKLGVTLNTPYQKVELAGKYMYDIGYGSIYACLDDDLDMDFCKAMIAYHDAQFPKEHAQDKKEERELEKYRLETTTFIFRDSSFADDNIKTNILQTLRQMGLTNIRAI